MDTTLALAVILSSGFFAARLGRLIKLPAVTGYIAAGITLGPMGLGLIDHQGLGVRLEHFNQLALMLIAFGIGEHLEIKRLRSRARLVLTVAAGEIIATATAVGFGTFAALQFSANGVGDIPGGITATALLLAAIAVATAPAATMHVIAELKAGGRLSATILQVVAMDNVCALILFGFSQAAAGQLSGANMPLLPVIAVIISRVVLALLLGGVTGLIIDALVHGLKRRGDMLTIGIALLLLSGETARFTGLSPLLCGMAAGCAIVNRDRRDVRLFRSLNAFEPPIYVLFFTLAGCHLNLESLKIAGWLGIVYFITRVAGKGCGAFIGAAIAGEKTRLRQSLGISLIPQAGLAIGLLVLIESDPSLDAVARIITPIVLSGVLLAELFGPTCTRMAIRRSGEADTGDEEKKKASIIHSNCDLENGISCALVPWRWPRLSPVNPVKGSVLVGASHTATIAGLTRMAALFAHHRRLRLTCAHIHTGGTENNNTETIFNLAENAAAEINYPVETITWPAAAVAEGLIACAREKKSRMLVLGCPLEGTASGFQKVVDQVAAKADFRIVVIRFSGTLHTEKILVPVTGMEELEDLREIIAALAAVGDHRISIVRLLRSDAGDRIIKKIEAKLELWTRDADLTSPVRCRALATDARVEAIDEMAVDHDFIVMNAGSNSLKRYVFGSLASDVARRCHKPMLLIYGDF